MTSTRKDHWNGVYESKVDSQLSWHQDDPAVSLELIALAAPGADGIIDIGGGTSRLAAILAGRGHEDLSVLDISEAALSTARQQAGQDAGRITWIAADITRWEPARQYELWHDRAVFHFLTDAADRAAYLDRMNRALRPGGHAVIATFALDGPEKCSGLPVVRYSPESLAETLGPGYALMTQRHFTHKTPWDSAQSFQYSLLRKLP